MKTNRTKGYLISGILNLVLTLTTLFLIFLFIHPTVYFSKASGFSQHDGVRAGKNKLRLVVPETVDTTKSTYISVKQEWFETSRMGKITGIKAKQGKHLALDFTDREYNQEVLTIYTKNWFGIKREHDVIVDYSNFLRIFFPESHDGVAPRKPVILPYSKLQTEYKHIYEELYKMKGFVAFDEKGHASGQPVSKEEVFVKENARGRAFIVNNNTHISLVYDFVLPGIFKNQAQKTQVYDLVEKVMGKARTLDPESQGLEIKLNTPPFYISKFLGWYYIDPVGNRVDLKPGEEFLIPQWVKSELRLIAKYDITTDTDKIGPELDKQGLVAISYFDGAERVFFDIVKKGSPLKEHVYQKPGYTYEGWYRDSSLTEKVNFAYEVASAHTVLYLKSIKQNQPQPEKPVKYHTVNFITPSDANQLLSTRRAHGQKLETNYLTPSLVSRLDENGNLWELDYWNLVDPITGTRTRFDFNTPITEDITLEAVMRKSILPTSKYTIKRYFESVNQAGNFIEDKSKEEVVENQTPGQEVQLSPTQTNAPTGFKLADGTITNKKINKDGTTVFELKYTRNRYKVNFEVNYNGNHFKDVSVSSTPEQTVPFEGKLTKPANPTITKAGYTYTFKHWQLKDEMGNVYKQVSEFDFNTKITKNLTLVAYFEEKKDTATYTVKHIFQGIQNQIDERVEEKKFTEQVGKSITVTQENRDKGFDQHFEVADFSETKKVEADGSTVFEIRYARKKYKVNFVVNYNNHFQGATASVEAEQEIPYEGKVAQPHINPSLTELGYNYIFKHWQSKEGTGHDYNEATPFDFNNTKIIKNTTLVAYFVKETTNTTYKIQHIFEGVDSIPERTEITQKSSKTNTAVTVTKLDRLSGYDHGFTVNTPPQTEIVKADGSTTFTLRYIRKEFTVSYIVNYKDQFSGNISQIPVSQKVKYEGKAQDPGAASIEKHGRTYTFRHWQLLSSMNGTYTEQTPYNFANKVTEDISLVAYFTETINKVNYKIVHYLENQGESETLNGTYDEVVEEQKDQLVENKAKYKKYSGLDENLYEADNTKSNVLEHELTVGDNSVRVYQYYKLKETKVNFIRDAGINSISEEIKMVKKTREITLPAYTLKPDYDFVGWSNTLDGSIESKFIAAGSSMQIYAKTKLQVRQITYTIKAENADGSYGETTLTKYEKPGSIHTVDFANPDSEVYENPKYSVSSLTVNQDESQNKVTVTLFRKKFTITFKVLDYDFKIDDKQIRYGDKIGNINIKNILDAGYFIIKYQLDELVKPLLEINEYIVKKNHKITIYVSDEEVKTVGKYPQTYVENPEGIYEVETVQYEIKYKYIYKDYVYAYTRKYYNDKYGNKYEKYHGKYFRFEDIVFTRLPLSNIWLSKKIMDYAPINAITNLPNDNGNLNHSILKAIVDHINTITGYNFSLPTYDNGKFSLKAAYDSNKYAKFAKIGTDYGKEVLGKDRVYTTKYRDIDFAESMLDSFYKIWDDYQYFDYWWVATNINNNSVYSFRHNGTLYDREINISNGIVLACE